MILLLFGPPGSGKGTQSAKLVERQGFCQISTGDLLRSSIREGTTLGIKAKSYMDNGDLVPDEVVIGMVDGVLRQKLHAGISKFIFDGFPRTVEQARRLDGLLEQSGLKADEAVFIEISRSELVKRLTGRRVCSSCGAVYHVTTSPSKTDGICDKCGGNLIQRSDDQESVIKSRLDIYDSAALVLRRYYEGQGVARVIDGNSSVEDVYQRIISKNTLGP